MKNALGYKFEKKNKEHSDQAKDQVEKKDQQQHERQFSYKNKKKSFQEDKAGSHNLNKFDNGWKPFRNSFGNPKKRNGEQQNSSKKHHSSKTFGERND